jgi:PAS domain S-box-containing protein
LRDADGNIAGAVAAFIDITERKRAEAALRRSEERLRLFIENAPASIAQFDRQMRYIAVSRRWLKDYGITGDVIGRSHYEVFPEIPETWKEVHRRALGGEIMRSEGDRFERADGSVQWVKWETLAWRDAAGEVGGILIATEDITPRKQAEAALNESEERERLRRRELEAILEAIPAAVFIAEDPVCARMSLNRAGQELLRLSADANASKSAPEGEAPQHFEVRSKGRILTPDELPLQRAVATKSMIEGAEFELHFVDGDCKHFFGNALPLLDDGGVVRGAVGAFLDITDRKMAYDALRDSEERLRHLGDSLPQSAVYRYGHEASGAPRFHYISAGIEPMNGVRVEDVLRDPGMLHGQILPDYLSKLIEKERLSALELSDFEMEIPMRRPDGELRWMRLQSRPHRTDDGAVIWDGVQTDITERKRAEEALRESEERFRGIFEHAATGISITDLEYRFQSCNPAYTAMLGYTEEELRAASFPDLVHPEDREPNLMALRQLVAQEIPWFEIVNRYVAKDGKPIWVNKHVSLLRGASGAPTRLIALVTDISERKRQEEQVSLLMREVNHRAKNMLALVQAIARQTAAIDPEDFVERFGERISALAASQDLLVKAEWRGADLHELIRSQLAHFSDLIGTRIEPRGPSLFILASAAQTIGMALHELATNAGKYGALSTFKGRVEIGWSLERTADRGERFVMSWRESGGPPVVKPARAGFGSTVISRMARMSFDADVELDFAPEGLIWRLECPSDNVLEGRSRAAIAKSAERAARCARSNARPHILVVEDEALVALDIAQALTNAGFDIVGPANSVAHAIELIQDIGCDGAVLDINLGGETSEPVARELNDRGTAFVTLSGYSHEQRASAFEGAAALAKPLQRELLVAELRRCLEQKEGISIRRAVLPAE